MQKQILFLLFLENDERNGFYFTECLTPLIQLWRGSFTFTTSENKNQ